MTAEIMKKNIGNQLDVLIRKNHLEVSKRDQVIINNVNSQKRRMSTLKDISKLQETYNRALGQSG